MKKQYETDYSKDYQKVHDLVYEYKSGSLEVVNELIKSFNKFFLKYIYFIKYQKCNDSSSVKKFKSLFSKNADIIYKIFIEFSDEDLKHDLIIIFFKMCKNYKDAKPSFHTYVARNFHYYAYRYWEKMIRDPVGKESTISIYTPINSEDNNSVIADLIEDIESEVENEYILNEIAIYYKMKQLSIKRDSKNCNVYNNTFLNEDWINGLMCSTQFKILTTLERKIIKLSYADNATDKKIGEQLEICRATVNKKKNTAKKKISEYLKNSKKDAD